MVCSAEYSAQDIAPVSLLAVVPAATPQRVVAKLNQVPLDALRRLEARHKLAAIGVEPVGSTPQALRAHLQSERDTWGRVISKRGIRAD